MTYQEPKKSLVLEAVEKAESLPDLIYMDIQMPEMDGIEACKIIKQKYPNIPIIALTAGIGKKDRDRCIAAGMDGYLTKPFSISELRDSINEFEKIIGTSNIDLAKRFHELEKKYNQKPLAEAARPAQRAKPVRIGYFSADFHDHATMYLMARVFEKHSKSDFEIYAYSYGPNTNDCMRKRLTAAVDKFHNVRQLSDFDIAALARDHEIDIAVDLKGYTQNTRLGIFAFKAAPIQISYIGYPGSLGAPFIDYIIADPVVIPRAYESAYAEKIIFLPHSYQANDDMRPIANTVYSRSQLGLPADAFVLCCFNNSYKIIPCEFDIWMRVLSQIEGSVLWLLEANKWVSQNLRSAAQARGIDPSRLIFAPKLAHDEHLARHSCADLFIDTFNVNAHTTASDALWAGLPLVTKAGKGFAARVAASLLTAIGLPELIVETEAAYEALILDLARSPQQLQAVTKKLAQNRRTSPLFDAALLTNHLDTGYRAAYQRWAEQKPPAHIRVGP